MLAITIELLSGRYIATAYNDRDRVEWPPHPARLFSALVATWAEADPRSPEGEAERAALEWLEQQPAPELLASSHDDIAERAAVTVFVPVNDTSVVSAPDREKLDEAESAWRAAAEPAARARAEKEVRKLQQKLEADTARAIAPPARPGKHDGATGARALVATRTRQPRTFPCATPTCPMFAFVWSGAEAPPPVRAALERLAARLVRLGHSSSLTRAIVTTVPVTPDLADQVSRFVPDEESGDLVIRWVGPGQTRRLVRDYDFHRETAPRVMPARFVRYREGTTRRLRAAAPRGVFGDDLIILARTGGPRLPITSVAGLSRQLRRALMAAAPQPVAEVISGHRPDGTPSGSPHLAIAPLPFITGPNPDGAILGVALILPRDLAPDARAAVMTALARLQATYRKETGDEDAADTLRLRLGESGELILRRDVWGEDPRTTLAPWAWTHPSRRWATATPIALDRNPGDLHAPDAAKRRAAFEEATASVIESVQRLGLPTPIEVDVLRSCVLPGTAKPGHHPRFPADSRRPQRVLVHARLEFAEDVGGPILLGAGRFHGLGLCLPIGRDR